MSGEKKPKMNEKKSVPIPFVFLWIFSLLSEMFILIN